MQAKLILQCLALKKNKANNQKEGYFARVGIKAERLAKLVSHMHG